VSAIHGTTLIIGSHWDSILNLYVGDFSITTGTFPKYFTNSADMTNDLNYIEATLLVIASVDYINNIEIHDTS
jgi:hypothetical protein